MKTKRRIFFVNCLQLLQNPWFYLCTVGVCILAFFSIRDYYQDFPGQDVYYYFDLFRGLSMYKKLLAVFAAVPFCASFCSDWNCQYIKPVIVRCGLKRYTISKVAACFLSAFATVFLGLCLFILLFLTKQPLYPDQPASEFALPPFGSLVKSPIPALYILAEVCVLSMACALWAVVGLAISAYIPNRFVAIATPLIASYLLERLTGYLPYFLDLYKLTNCSDVIGQGPLLSFGYFTLVFVGFSCLAGWAFHHQVKRRVRNEVV